jgi:RNA polymerase sigma-70 factor (family 1)
MKEAPILLLQKRVAYDRDQSAYREIFLHFYKPLLNFAKSFVGTHEASEEIVSDVMLRIWELKEELGNVANLRLYLFTAVRNRAFNHLTRTKKHLSWDGKNGEIEFKALACTESPEKMLESKELKAGIVLAVKSLPPKCRMVYKLVRENGMSYKEVGTLMNISTNTVDRHLNTALHKIVHAVRVHFC